MSGTSAGNTARCPGVGDNRSGHPASVPNARCRRAVACGVSGRPSGCRPRSMSRNIPLAHRHHVGKRRPGPARRGARAATCRDAIRSERASVGVQAAEHVAQHPARPPSPRRQASTWTPGSIPETSTSTKSPPRHTGVSSWPDLGCAGSRRQALLGQQSSSPVPDPGSIPETSTSTKSPPRHTGVSSWPDLGCAGSRRRLASGNGVALGQVARRRRPTTPSPAPPRSTQVPGTATPRPKLTVAWPVSPAAMV